MVIYTVEIKTGYLDLQREPFILIVETRLILCRRKSIASVIPNPENDPVGVSIRRMDVHIYVR
jgi:hypothetical protein